MMATVVFDFDSTLVSCETLDKLLQQKLEGFPDKQKQLHEITLAGLEGTLPFADSLAERLRIAAPSKMEVEAFGQQALSWITPGMEELVQELQRLSIDLWVVSGGIQETLYPVAEKLRIPRSQVLGVSLIWNEEGGFGGVDPSDPFARSKVEGALPLVDQWTHPVIMVGDAMSDFALYQEGLVDHFILFTHYFRCQAILDTGACEAKDVVQLRKHILGKFDGNSTFI